MLADLLMVMPEHWTFNFDVGLWTHIYPALKSTRSLPLAVLTERGSSGSIEMEINHYA